MFGDIYICDAQLEIIIVVTARNYHVGKWVINANPRAGLTCPKAEKGLNISRGFAELYSHLGKTRNVFQ